MSDNSKTSKVVAGAIIAGAAVTAAVLSNKKTRTKAKNAVKTIVKKGKQILKTPEGKAVVETLAEGTLSKVVDEKSAKKIVDIVLPETTKKKD